MSIYLICMYVLIAAFVVVSALLTVILIRNKRKFKKISYENFKQKKSSLYIKYNMKNKKININSYAYLNMDICKSIIEIGEKEEFHEIVNYLISNTNDKKVFIENKGEIVYNLTFSFRSKSRDNVVLRCDCDIEKKFKSMNLYNIEELKEIHEESKQKKSVLFYLNVKDFNSINQRYSQECGDYILEVLKARFLKFNRKNLYCCYMNSDQFVVYYNKNISKKRAVNLIKSINKKITKPIDVGYINIDLVIGIGVCIGQYENLEEFLKGAYIAADYARKRKNYNIVIYNEGMKLEENVMSVCENELDDILTSKEVAIRYNPVFNHSKSKFMGYISDIDFEDKKIDYDKVKNIAIQNDKIDSLMNIVIDNQLVNYLKKRPNKSSKLFIKLKLEDLSNFLEVYFSNPSYSDCKIVICLNVRKGYEMINKFSNISSNISKIIEEGIELAVIINYSNMYDYDYILKNANYLILDGTVIENVNSTLAKNKLMNIIDLAKNYDLDMLAIDIKEYIQFESLIKYGVNYFSGLYFGKGSRRPNEIEQSKTRIFAKFLKDSKKNKNN